MTPDLTEKLKGLLMGCEFPNEKDEPLFRVRPSSYALSNYTAKEIAKQLAPEIEKLMPRWIPVSERLPDDVQLVDLWYDSIRYENMFFHINNGASYFLSVDTCTICFVSDKKTTHWMTIPKGPMG